MTSPIRVLVVDDSLTVRKHIVEVLSSATGLEVVGEAADGKAAIELCEKLRPDVITMDMVLPVMSGVSATEYIMAYVPTPILIVSSSTNRGELFRTYDALAAGAVDVLDKRSGGEADEEWERRLVEAVRLTSRVRVIRHPRARLGAYGQASRSTSASPSPSAPMPAPREPTGRRHRLVAIGVSTGGPAALLTVLGSLPTAFPLPILLVLHIAEPFGMAMTQWLDGQIGLDVRYARNGEPLPRAGCVLMAPPDQHLTISEGVLRLNRGPERHSCRPSVDVLFESLADQLGDQVIGCLLTGMGKDGAAGLLALRKRGALTIAQDEETSVVFGMPGEAVRLNAATKVLPLGEIAGALTRATHPHAEGWSG